MLALYSLLYYLVLVLILPFQYLKRKSKIRAQWLSERMGIIEGESWSADDKVIWIHAVSVGEVIGAVSFIEKLTEKYPEFKIVVSTVTDTGRLVANDRLGKIARIVYMPFDMKFSLDRAFSTIHPSLFVIMETEIWPNLIACLKRRNIPIAMMNGRISENSYKGYMRIRSLLSPMLASFDLMCMQDDVYLERIKAMGGVNAIKTGSFKFDIKVKDEELKWVDNLSSEVIVAGSTHSGEDGIIIDAYKKLKADYPGLSLIIAPRHPERAGEVIGEIKKRALDYHQRSLLADDDRRVSFDGTVLVLDTVGELSSVYHMADIAIIGGSFIEHGGQNFLEPAYWGKPVLCGPYMSNFPYIDEFYANDAALGIDAAKLYDTLLSLLADKTKRDAIGGRAQALVAANRGAVDASIEALDKVMVRNGLI